ncbi:MAG: hypothetical protein RL030_2116, partial [Pseudomonadota bacterium]
PLWRRRFLAWVFRRLLRSIARPQRAGLALINQLVAEFPELANQRQALRRAVRDEFRDHAPHSDVTWPETHPLTVEALGQRREFTGTIADLRAGWRSQPWGTGRRLATLLGVQAVCSLAYTGVAAFAHRLVPNPPALPLTGFDRWLPEFPPAIIGYHLLAPYLLISIWLPQDRFVRLLYAGILASAMGYACFLVMPMEYPRGSLPAGEPWRTLTDWLRMADRPVNTLPSLHVAYSVLLGCAFARQRWRWWVWMTGAVIVASTMLIRQHASLDVVAGAVLAMACWSIIEPAPILRPA